ncbi:hypothetical protein [Rhodovulum sulfidophilum]|uniref:Uncharacterized protein n=1 Tax=Rhodovulum sulfidophilum TaxID=35806 RepID=A0ABS1RX11_RHOSU|nr:hypothetical protein [Rhodovulum sulfidophilum]MBL3610619.1 hypothetical protein [Rhodovulum sulfidophilum]MCE8456442.1 hypothetical protein [Rhodovulum sulfidophilum]
MSLTAAAICLVERNTLPSFRGWHAPEGAEVVHTIPLDGTADVFPWIP